MNIQNLNKEITIVIVLFRENFDLISQTLSLIQNFKIIIIDNSNNLNLKKKIEAHFLIDKYILNKKNIGFSAANNQGIQLSNTTFTLVLNPDCLISENSIILLKEKLLTYKDCLIVTATSYDNNNNYSFTSGLLPENRTNESVLVISGDTCVESALGACFFFKTKDIINNNLLFDENMFLFYSDHDLCRRVKNLKKSIIQVKNAKSQHMHGISKVKNKFLSKYLREYHYSYDEYYYYYKINGHRSLLEKFKKKIPSLYLKMFFKLFFLKLIDSIEIFSRLSAYYKFKKKINLK
ncbi:glycosyltransferase [Candidatus Pelagibacter sp.]|nr:glycosyltransferase [Candidatus Pelagibacter sp.]